MIGEIPQSATESAYQPTGPVLHVTSLTRKDMSYGISILDKSFTELNSYSPIQRTNKDQRTFQSFVDESVDNPYEAWKWIGTRSLARKKAFAMHAHLTATYSVPGVYPQNESQKGDKEMAFAMRDIVEWETINSNYRPSYLLATMGMLVNPVTYLQTDYNQVDQKIQEKTDDGYQETHILDEVLSGVNFDVLSINQVLITNVYEQNIQRQRTIIKRRYVEYSELKAQYGNHPNWDFLQAGVKVIYDDANSLFYDVRDEDHPYLVEEVIRETRRDDSGIPFLNGIYFGNDNVDWNPIKHRDNRNAPKYNIVPFGYHRINEHFFYYSSLMFEVGWDDQLIDAMYQTTMNREFLDAEQPILVSGVGKIDTSIVFPGGVSTTENPDAKVQNILPPKAGNLYRALQ